MEKGIEKVSMLDIAKEAGVGKGTIYIYFNSKEDLIREIIKNIYNTFITNIEDALENSNTPYEFIDKVVDNLFDSLETRGKLIYMANRKGKIYNDVRKEFVEKYKKALHRIHEKFSLKMDFELLYFTFTSFIMSSYIMFNDFKKETIKSMVKRTLKKLIQ